MIMVISPDINKGRQILSFHCNVSSTGWIRTKRRAVDSHSLRLDFSLSCCICGIRLTVNKQHRYTTDKPFFSDHIYYTLSAEVK